MALDARLPLYHQLRDDLASAIARQVWRPGDCIPTEAELAATHGVAIGTVRKAVDSLVAEGVLERRQGKGTFVRRAQFNSSLFRFFRFQDTAGERRIPESRILHRDVLAAPSAIASALRLPVETPVIRLSRVRLIEGTPLLVEDIWLPQSRFAALVELPSGDFGDLLYPLYDERCGQMVVSADETLTVEIASPSDARLLRLAPGVPVIVIERTAFDLERVPIEWRRSRGPADKFRYQVEIR